MTAAELPDALAVAGCAPTIDGPAVVFDADPPAELARDLDVLPTGVRALLLGKRWYGIDCATGRFLGTRGALNPAAKLPRNVGLLVVEAQAERRDRLSPWVLDELPDRFLPELRTTTEPTSHADRRPGKITQPSAGW